jgi:hypothetical protein
MATSLRYGARVTGLDLILERQARQLKLLGIAMLVLGVVLAVAAVYLVATGAPLTSRFYGISGALVFGGSGIAALQRSRKVEYDLAERRRSAQLPTAVARSRSAG